MTHDKHSDTPHPGDFANTVQRLVDLAIARNRLAQDDAADPRLTAPAGREPDQRFAFQRMAAASAEAAGLPSEDDEALDSSQTLGLWVEPVVGETLRLHLQAKGYTAVDSIAERWATVASADRLIYLSVRFDDDGHAECDLPDVPEFRAALGQPMEVTVPGLRFGFRGKGDHDGAH